MKNIFSIIAFLFCLQLQAQPPRNVPVNPDSIKLGYLSGNGVVVYSTVGELTRTKTPLAKHILDSIALRGLINTNTTAISNEVSNRIAADNLKLDRSDSVLANRITANAAAISTEVTNRTNADALKVDKPVAYEGLVATRGIVANLYTGTGGNTQIMSRTPHFATQAITSLKIAIPNWYLPTNTSASETGTGTTATIKASIEYPSGTFTQVLFGGSATGSIPTLTTTISDYVNVSIPQYAQFWVRTLFINANGLVYQSQHSITGLGGGANVGTSLTDLTMTTGTISSSNTTFSPLAIIGFTTNPSIVFVGDSKANGVLDASTADATGNYGNISKQLNYNYGYISMASDGQFLSLFLASSANQRAMFNYASHVINALQFNDFWSSTTYTGANGITAATSFQTIVKGLGKKLINITIGPKTSSTDSWATVANQTISNATCNTNRLAYNQWVRNGGNGQDGYVDFAYYEEDYVNSGKWKVNGVANFFTSDGIHETSNGNQIIKASMKTEFQAAISNSLK